LPAERRFEKKVRLVAVRAIISHGADPRDFRQIVFQIVKIVLAEWPASVAVRDLTLKSLRRPVHSIGTVATI
jgi:hypothetical protein